MGHTLAGWTGTALASVGFTLCGLAVVATSGLLALAGAAVLLLALLTTWLLHLAGWGKPGGPRPAGLRHWRAKDPTARAGHTDCLGCRLAGRSGRTAAAGTPALPLPSRPSHGDTPALEPYAVSEP
ncbi:HGxxPAAW family protein [Streptomyces sp. enrichment culture]|uniref:HGxxPAAW family protein n=1 Tax=Streptomyces sp. enrichment culture TaxID=1795815 RepID=UPI003F55ADB3